MLTTVPGARRKGCAAARRIVFGARQVIAANRIVARAKAVFADPALAVA